MNIRLIVATSESRARDKKRRRIILKVGDQLYHLSEKEQEQFKKVLLCRS